VNYDFYFMMKVHKKVPHIIHYNRARGNFAGGKLFIEPWMLVNNKYFARESAGARKKSSLKKYLGRATAIVVVQSAYFINLTGALLNGKKGIRDNGATDLKIFMSTGQHFSAPTTSTTPSPRVATKII